MAGKYTTQVLAELDRNAAQREELFALPDNLDNLVAREADLVVPTVDRPQYTKYPSKVEAIDATIPVDHPMKGMLPVVKAEFSKSLQDQNLMEYSTKQLLRNIIQKNLTTPTESGSIPLEDMYKYKRKEDSNLLQWGESKKFKKLPGYDTWLVSKQKQENAKAAEDPWYATPADIEHSAMMGAATGFTLGAVFGMGGSAVPGAISTGAAFAALEIPGKPIRKLIEDSEWGRARADSPKLIDKLKVIGAGSLPYLGVDLGVRKAIPKVITALAANDAISKGLEEALIRSGGSAKQAIELGFHKRVVKAVEGAADDASKDAALDIIYDYAKRLQGGAGPTEFGLRSAGPYGELVPLVETSKSRFLTALEKETIEATDTARIGSTTVSGTESVISHANDAEALILAKSAADKAEMTFPARPRPIISMIGKPGVERTLTSKDMFKSLEDDAAEQALRNTNAGMPIDEAIVQAHEAQSIIQSADKRYNYMDSIDYEANAQRAAEAAVARSTQLNHSLEVRQMMWERETQSQELLKAMRSGVVTRANAGAAIVRRYNVEGGLAPVFSQAERAEAIATEQRMAGLLTKEEMKQLGTQGVSRAEIELNAFMDHVNSLPDVSDDVFKAVTPEITVQDLAKGGTKVVDETGVPKPLYHGTSRTYETPDLTKADPHGLYGPGYYMTDNPIVASTPGYTGHEPKRLANLINEFKKHVTDAEKNSAKIKGDFESGKINNLDMNELSIYDNDAAYYTAQIKELQEQQSQVRRQFASIKNPVDMDAQADKIFIDGLVSAYKKKYPSAATNPKSHPWLRAVSDFESAYFENTNSALYERLVQFLDNDTVAANKFLQELGYDGITHLGGKTTGGEEHRVWIAFKSEQVKTGWGNTLDSKVFSMLLPATVIGLTALSSLFGPSEAQAGGFSDTVSKVIAPILKTASKEGSLEATARMADELALSARPIVDPYIAPRPMEGLSIIGMAMEKFGDLANFIKRTKNLPMKMEKVLSPYSHDSIFMQDGAYASVEIASRQTAAIDNSGKRLQIVKNIMDAAGVKMERAVLDDISDSMKPVAEKFSGPITELRRAELQLEADTKQLSVWDTVISKKPKMEEKLVDKIEQVRHRKELLEKVVEDLKPQLDNYSTEWDEAIKPLAQKYATTRIALATEDTAEFTHYPWLKDMMSFEEKTAVARLKNMNYEYQLRFKTIDLDVITDRPFIHHAWHPAWTEEAAIKRMESLNLDLGQGLPYTELHPRSMYSRMMVPDVGYIMKSYIPNAEKTLMWAQFWNKGNPNGWSAFRQLPQVRGSDALRTYFDRIEASSYSAANTTANQWANRYTLFEVARLIGAAPAPAFKHFFKNAGTWSTLGVRESIAHLPEAVTTAWRIGLRESADRGLMSKIGIKGPGTQKIFTDNYIKSYTQTNNMMNIIADLDMIGIARRTGVYGVIDDYLEKTVRMGGSLIGSVEAMDRTHSVIAATMMAQKSGLTGTQAIYGIYDTILKNNFLSGALNPSWLRDPKIRMLTLFQSTPFKIWERRFVNAYRTGNVVKTAIGNLKGEGLVEALKQMSALKLLVKGGEDSFKGNMIADAIRSEKDFFGTPIAKQFVKECIISGLIVGGGASLGLDLMPQVGHIPFVNFDQREPSLRSAPIVGAAFNTLADRRAANKAGEPNEFFVTNFIQNWLGSSHYIPLTVHKALRASQGDIPELYRGSWLQYMFSIPTKE